MNVHGPFRQRQVLSQSVEEPFVPVLDSEENDMHEDPTPPRNEPHAPSWRCVIHHLVRELLRSGRMCLPCTTSVLRKKVGSVFL